MIQLPFRDRADAGRLLALELERRDLPLNTIVIALPRGGVPVGFEIAHALGVPLDVVIARKLGVPWQPELAMGAIAGEAVVLDERLIREIPLRPGEIDAVIARERAEIERREKLYRAGRPAAKLEGRTVVLVDDGLATGSTMIAAARHVRSSKPARLIIAVPVSPADAGVRIRPECNEFVTLATPVPFMAVGCWYVDFRQTTDGEVQELLNAATEAVAPTGGNGKRP